MTSPIPTSGASKKQTKRQAVDTDELRDGLLQDDAPTFDVREVQSYEVSEGKIFGLAAGERMILSVILFLAVSVISIALLFATNTIAIP
jgi:hypothetical protein